MIVIVEGIDGAGKTDVVEYLEEKHGFNFFNKDMKGHKFANMEIYKKCLEAGEKDLIVLDRFIYSEWVYGQSLRNYNFNLQIFEAHLDMREKNIVLLLVDLDQDIAKQRILIRDGKAERQSLGKERNLFIKAFNFSIVKKKMAIYNDDFEFVKKMVDAIII